MNPHESNGLAVNQPWGRTLFSSLRCDWLQQRRIANRSSLMTVAMCFLFGTSVAFAEAPPLSDYCQRLQQEIQGKKHGFLAGNLTYYVGGFHASWKLKEHETLGLTHPFHHDLRSRGVGLVQSQGKNHDDTGLGND